MTIAGRAHTTADQFERVVRTYDLGRMSRARVVQVGCGGAAELAESLFRAGLGEIVLIDPDTVEAANLATQPWYADEIGLPKVEALGRRLERLRPVGHAPRHAISTLPVRAQELTTNSWKLALKDALPGRDEPEAVLLVGATDDFDTQAWLNRLALSFGIPLLCGQAWPQGRGAEVTLTRPGSGLPCHRCLLGPRYEARSEDRLISGSEGTTFFVGPRRNALMAQLATMVLHSGSAHPRWAALEHALGRRNMAWIRLDPDIANSLGVTAFDRRAAASGDAFGFDETIWFGRDPDPACADCGGLGC